MPRNLKYALACWLAVILAACSDQPPPQLGHGDSPPVFETVGLDGTNVHFPADFAGRAVVVRFWADWCKFCAGEMKAMEPIYQRYRSRNIEVLAVNAGQDRATAAAFIAKLGISYPALLDEEAAIARRYSVVGLPTTYFIGRDGKIAAKQIGEMSAEAFEQRLAALAAP